MEVQLNLIGIYFILAIRLLNAVLPCGLYDRIINLILRRSIESEGQWVFGVRLCC